MTNFKKYKKPIQKENGTILVLTITELAIRLNDTEFPINFNDAKTILQQIIEKSTQERHKNVSLISLHVFLVLSHLDSDELLMIKSWQKFAGICLS